MRRYGKHTDGLFYFKKRNELLRITFRGQIGGKYKTEVRLAGRERRRGDGKGRREKDTEDISKK